MLFNSLQFLLFFPVVTTLYFVLPHRARWLHLLLASCYFYMAFIPAYILILAFTIVVDYLAAFAIAGAVGRRRKVYLAVSLVANVGVLAFFKYYNFLNGAGADLAHVLGSSWPIPFLAIVLPIGLSFHTFQAMSYTIEVYRGNQEPERHLGIYALYVMFYPQLVAGPIERPQNLLHQLKAHHHFDSVDAREGLRLMFVGFLKKVLVADRLAVVVNHVYQNPHDHDGGVLLLATILFAVQIYADFSGYSDIALGAARFMGIRLMVNFERPYMARSIAEFWKRWHISLSTWFRDYLYVSLGGNRVPWRRWQLNLFVTFLVSGLWHGANWTFLAWGGLNGLYLVVGNSTRTARARLASMLRLQRIPRLHAAWQVLLTFVMTCAAWVYFRANSIADAHHVFRTIASGRGLDPRTLVRSLEGLAIGRREVAIALVAALGLLVFDYVVERHITPGFLDRQPRAFRWTLYYAGAAAILLGGMFGEQQFIYFQF